MKFDYFVLPDQYPRPVVPVTIEGISNTNFLCLVDSGAIHNRFDASVAELLGIDLGDCDPVTPFYAGSHLYTGFMTQVNLSIGELSWYAPVCFVPDWQGEFPLLGHEGFFRWFEVGFYAADSYLTLEYAAH
ncbi:retropepsin-like aspartic protease [Micromonospora sp. WMMD882]|uniref:retropepsin-like aspartic protease n=1 Tax=Micromonospora sp. WMMD882 TaxID=3015151 RepID=UPI00248B1FD2|nr:retropepsin-like aspartic protease [Micromonospora sp. WMMD882]WBB78788.1 retropepsin-like aspartic protease [Micromonospora sp. WMMD882]